MGAARREDATSRLLKGRWSGGASVGYFRSTSDLDSRVFEVADLFQDAALGAGDWNQALAGLAYVAGGFCGELIGLGEAAAVPFNWMSGLPAEAATEFMAAGGGDPRINSRVRAGLRAAELEILDESAFTTEEDARRHPAYGDWLERYDIGDVCLTPLLRRDDMLIGLAFARSGRQGPVASREKRIFAALAPYARSAVRVQMAMEAEGRGLLSNLLDALSVHAVLCDADGRVKAMSPPAEALVANGGHLRVKGGRLQAARPADAIALQSALADAAGAGQALATPARPIVLRDATGGAPLLLEVTHVPGRRVQQFGAAVLVVARPCGQSTTPIGERAQALLGLTHAETAVAAQMAAGAGPQAIAERTGVSTGTVRTHIRNLFAKAGVRSQVELLARFADLR